MEARFLLDLQLAWDLHQASHSPAGKNIRKIKRMTSTVGGNFHQAQFGHTMGGRASLSRVGYSSVCPFSLVVPLSGGSSQNNCWREASISGFLSCSPVSSVS